MSASTSAFTLLHPVPVMHLLVLHQLINHTLLVYSCSSHFPSFLSQSHEACTSTFTSVLSLVCFSVHIHPLPHLFHSTSSSFSFPFHIFTSLTFTLLLLPLLAFFPLIPPSTLLLTFLVCHPLSLPRFHSSIFLISFVIFIFPTLTHTSSFHFPHSSLCPSVIHFLFLVLFHTSYTTSSSPLPSIGKGELR